MKVFIESMQGGREDATPIAQRGAKLKQLAVAKCSLAAVIPDCNLEDFNSALHTQILQYHSAIVADVRSGALPGLPIEHEHLLAEASLCFPLDEKIADAVHDAQAVRAQLSVASSENDLMAAMAALQGHRRKEKAVEQKISEKAIADFNEAMNKCQGIRLQASNIEKVVTFMDKCTSWLVSVIDAWGEAQQPLVKCLIDACAFFSGDTHVFLVALFGAVAEALRIGEQMREVSKITGDATDSEKLLRFRGTLARLDKLVKTAEATKDKCEHADGVKSLLKCLMDLRGNARALDSSSHEVAMEASRASLAEDVRQLKDVSSGSHGGKRWTDGLNSSTFENFVASAAAFLESDMTSVDALIKSTQANLSRDEHVRSLASNVDETELHKSARAHLYEAQISIKMQEILHILVGKDMSQKQQKDKLQTAVRTLRTIGPDGTREKDVMPSVMWAQCMVVLKKG